MIQQRQHEPQMVHIQTDGGLSVAKDVVIGDDLNHYQMELTYKLVGNGNSLAHNPSGDDIAKMK